MSNKDFTRDDVRDVYHSLLGRDPESEAVVENHFNNCQSLSNLLQVFYQSTEFRNKIKTKSTEVSGRSNEDFSAYPGRRIVSLAELDKELLRAAEARKISEAHFLKALSQFYLYRQPPEKCDPWGNEYKIYWQTLYEEIAEKKYSVENEIYDFDVELLAKKPYPYCTEDFNAVSEQLMAMGSIVKGLALPRGSRILEMGPGCGNISIVLAQMGHKVTVVDMNRKYGLLIEKRAEKASVHIDFVCSDFSATLPFGSDFDCVLFYESFHHSYDHLALLDSTKKYIAESGILALAGEPINERIPFDWGINLGGEALWQIRNHGWFELVFRESYLLKTLAMKDFSVRKHGCQSPRGAMYVCSKKK
jgi:2-polyprenyl-3-methyl-5-hydroxy-6-metoxy-1,4-benzoquinol methylase